MVGSFIGSKGSTEFTNRTVYFCELCVTRSCISLGLASEVAQVMFTMKNFT